MIGEVLLVIGFIVSGLAFVIFLTELIFALEDERDERIQKQREENKAGEEK